MTHIDHEIFADQANNLSSPVQEAGENESITDKMLFALGMYEDDKLSLTIFEKGKGATICLNKVFAEYLVENINHYIQLMK